ncbi:MAG: M23 family metallopeptidase [Oscillospiraceae bacterium]|jgi:hypothetical protein|nr:M23 family metallopeptidase [Oscillospiraceae bacterium]
MHKPKYNYRGRSRKRERGNGWKRFCAIGIILGFALTLNAFYGTELREFAGIKFGTRGYSAALSAIGGAIRGETTLPAAWNDAVSALSVPYGNLDGAVPVFTQPIMVSGASGGAAFDLICRGGEFGLARTREGASHGAESTESTDAADAVLTFDYAVTAAVGGEVAAYADGTVLAVGDSEIYGKYLIMFCGNITVQYFRLDVIKADPGQHVNKGDVIAEVRNNIGVGAEDSAAIKG